MDEVLDPTTSNEDLMDKFNEVNGTSDKYCEGNVSHECVQDTVNMIGDLYEDREDYTLVGGIPLQLKVLNHPQSSPEVLMREFGSRRTNDLDILSNNSQELQAIYRESEYSDQESLDLDFVDPSLFPGEGENIIENSEDVHVHGYDIDAEVRLPSDTHLFYTKVHDKPSRESTGTRHDAEYMATSNIMDIDGKELHRMISGQTEAQDYVENYLQF